MKYIWNNAKKLADNYGMNEVKVFITISIISAVCLFLFAYAIIASIVGMHMPEIVGASSIAIVLSGIVAGLFGSILWMLRNEEDIK